MSEREIPLFSGAAHADLPKIQQLLTAADLPIAGLEAQFPEAYVMCRQGEALIGVAGLERYGHTGLLRSVAVLPSHRGAGIGGVLIGNRLRYASDLGLLEVFLLTTTAPSYFVRLGFDRVERNSAPPALLESPEFTYICPSNAVCLRRPL